MKHRFLVRLLLVLLLLIPLGGCEFKDVDKRFFVTAIGVDKGEGGKAFKISLKVAVPKGQLQMGKEDYLAFRMDSDSITDAIQKMKTRVDKELDFGHTKVLVFGQGLVERDYREPLDWFARQRFIQRVAWAGIGRPTASDVIFSRQQSERLPANALILSFRQQGVESQYIVSQYLYVFYAKSKDPGESPVLPIIEPLRNETGGYFKIDRIGVLDHQQMKMELSPDETKYFNVLTGYVEKSDYSVTIPQGTFMIHADAIHSKIRYEDQPTPTIMIDVKIEGVVEERQAPNDLVSETVLQALARGTERRFADQSLGLLKKLQKEGVDPLGLVQSYRLAHWDDVQAENEQWKKLYPTVKFRLNVSCNLRAPGIIQ